MTYRLFCCLLAFCAVHLLPAQAVRFNEAVSTNSLFTDEDGDTPDWFELRNFSNEPINLAGWTVTDQATETDRWAFPSITLPAGGYLTVWASGKDRRIIGTARTLVSQGDEFRYLVPTQQPPANWTTLGFNDSTWPQGPSGFGYGDNDDATVITPGATSVFLRKTFTITDPTEISELVLDMDYDDGFVAYLNGTEIARANLTGTTPWFNQFATGFQEAFIVNGQQPPRFQIANFQDLLQAGQNVLSVQVHNQAAASSDLTAIPFLTAVFAGTTEQGIPVPDVLTTFSERSLHTNFRLAAAGETLYLADGEGNFIDSLVLPEQQSDVSYGIPINAPDSYVFFANPTPGAANDGSTFAGIITSKVAFSHQGGITTPLTLLLAGAAEGEEIRYTLDASEPTPTSPLYTQPININTTRVVRAQIYRTGYLSKFSQSRAYLIGANHTLPVVSLITEPNNFFHPDTGMYVLGAGYAGDFPYFGSNIWEDWERPVHLSFYETNGTLGTEFNAGTKIFGGWSRANEQRSLSIFARGKYGQSEIDYPFFSHLPYQQFQAIVLRNAGNDFLNSNLRDGTLTSLMTSADLEIQAYRPSVAYLNGNYWGILGVREKINEHYLASRHNIDPDSLDLLEFEGVAIHGDNQEYQEMIQFITTNTLASQANYEWVAEQMDINNFILYYASQIYFDNTDWPGNNVKFWRPKNGQWRWILFDTDFGFGTWNANAYTNNTLNFALEANGPGWPNPPWSTLLFRRLMDNTSFRNRFINRLADELNSRFLPARVVQHINASASRIATEVNRHYARWGGDAGYQANQVQGMRNFANLRPAYLKSYVRNRFNLAAIRRLTINNENFERGYVEVNHNLHIQETQWMGDYFQGVPITLRAVANPGYLFSHWEQGSTATEAEIELNMNSALQVRPVFMEDASFVAPLVINEINYRSAANFDTGDWIELYNPNDEPLDVSGYIFRDDDDTHAFVFPEETTIPANGFLVLVRSLADFRSFYPDLPNVLGEFDFGLSGTGDQIRIYNSALELQDSVAYTNAAPWPTTPDGQGATLELISPELNNELAINWAPINEFGSPGFPNSPNNLTEYTGQRLVPVSISPNPSNGLLVVNLELSTMARVHFTVFDAWGAQVHASPVTELPAGEQRLQTELNNLPAGAYFVRVMVDNTPQGVGRWIKQ